MQLPNMTLGAVTTTTGLVLRDLKLGPGSTRRQTAYIDYVAIEFVCFVDAAAVVCVQQHFRALCKRYGWHICIVVPTPKQNHIRVTLQTNSDTSTDKRRLPM